MTGWLRNVFGADKANDAQVAATEAALAGDQQALDYLKQREQLPMQLRDEALQGLAGFYEVPGQPKSQDQLIQEAMSSPLYGAIMGTKQDAVDEQARYASATGGLRSGNAQVAFGREAQRISNDALLESFNQVQKRDDYSRALNLGGLGALAGLESNDAAIASIMSDMGSTKAQGILGQGQTQTSATNNAFNTLIGLGQVAAAFSDIRLKENIRAIGYKDGFWWYGWDWNDEAATLGLEGSAVGLLAHEVFEVNPDAVEAEKGYLKVRYDMLEVH